MRNSRVRVSYVDERQSPEVFGTQQTDDYTLLIDLAKSILTEDEFAILMLVTAAGYKRREISGMLDMPVPTVTWRFNKAIEKMRKSLEENI